MIKSQSLSEARGDERTAGISVSVVEACGYVKGEPREKKAKETTGKLAGTQGPTRERAAKPSEPQAGANNE